MCEDSNSRDDGNFSTEGKYLPENADVESLARVMSVTGLFYQRH